MIVLYILLGAYLLFINIDAFALMALDKSRARRGGRRVPEATLFFLAFLGGSRASCWPCACSATRRCTPLSPLACR